MKRNGPDSLHGWFIVALTCFITTIFFGLTRVSSFMFADSITRYEVSREAASFPFMFVVFTMNLSGPLVGWLTPKLGQRLTICLGCLLATVGMAGCYLAESIHVVTVMYGFVFGLGNSFCVLVLPILIIQYFDKQRGTASAVSGLGMSFGAFVFSPLYEIFMEKYDLSGTFLILSGFLLNTIPAAMFLKEPNFKITNEQKHPPENKTEERQQLNTNRVQLYSEEKSSSDVKDCRDGIVEYITTVKRGSDTVVTVLKSKSLPPQSIEKSDTHPSKPSHSNTDSVPNKKQKSGSFSSFKVLLDPLFIMMVLTSSMNMVLMIGFGTILVDFAKDIKIQDEDLKYIPIASALGDLFGRICFGRIADKVSISKPLLVALGFLVQGFLELFIVWSTNVYIFLAIQFLKGCFTTIPMIVSILVIAEFFEKHQQIMVMSSTSFLAAPLSLCVSPLIGYFRENLGSYVYMFYTVSGLTFLCSLLWLLTPCLSRCRRTEVKERNVC